MRQDDIASIRGMYRSRLGGLCTGRRSYNRVNQDCTALRRSRSGTRAGSGTSSNLWSSTKLTTIAKVVLGDKMLVVSRKNNNLFMQPSYQIAMSSSIFFIVMLLALVFSIPCKAYAQGAGMTVTTSKGTLDIRLEWTLDPKEERKANFRVSFLNPGTDTLHQHQDYDFRILKNDQVVFSAARQTGQALIHNVEGTITVPYTFQEEGDYTIQVYLAGTGIAPTIPTDEEANFPTDIPEFPAAALGGIVAALMTATILLARYRRLS